MPGTPISIRLRADDGSAVVELHNAGPHIPPELVDRIFEYGVSGDTASGIDDGAGEDRDRTAPQRGQGLFVAKTYMAKMGGTIAAENVADGVRIVLSFPCVVA